MLPKAPRSFHAGTLDGTVVQQHLLPVVRVIFHGCRIQVGSGEARPEWSCWKEHQTLLPLAFDIVELAYSTRCCMLGKGGAKKLQEVNRKRAASSTGALNSTLVLRVEVQTPTARATLPRHVVAPWQL
eukprot:5442707-Amphidinium_carterae.1